jgi:hypothetical protein
MRIFLFVVIVIKVASSLAINKLHAYKSAGFIRCIGVDCHKDSIPRFFKARCWCNPLSIRGGEIDNFHGYRTDLSATAGSLAGAESLSPVFNEGSPQGCEISVLFLGTGVSTGIPKLGCILRPDPTRELCAVCQSAMDPRSRNRRCNVSIMIQIRASDGTLRNIMVDAGKTMREACLRHLPSNGIRGIDAILLTHAHADAILGKKNVFLPMKNTFLNLQFFWSSHRVGRCTGLFRAKRRACCEFAASPGLSESGNLRRGISKVQVRSPPRRLGQPLMSLSYTSNGGRPAPAKM